MMSNSNLTVNDLLNQQEMPKGRWAATALNHLQLMNQDKLQKLLMTGGLQEFLEDIQSRMSALEEATIQQAMKQNPMPKTTDTRELMNYHHLIQETVAEKVLHPLLESLTEPEED